MKLKKRLLAGAILIITASGAYGAEPPKMKFKADVPSSILTPDSVETRLGTLRFSDGAPPMPKPSNSSTTTSISCGA